uniref:Uncharacterized protein n=1 Tax=Arundo donax TaxID=35708 RepID=A0A0A9GJ77_ARUDO
MLNYRPFYAWIIPYKLSWSFSLPETLIVLMEIFLLWSILLRDMVFCTPTICSICGVYDVKSRMKFAICKLHRCPDF